MASFSADFTNKTGPAQVTDGYHTATIEEAAAGVSQNNNIKIDLRWAIDSSDDEANVGRKTFDVLTLTPAAFFRAVALVDACQLDVSELDGVEIDMAWAKRLAAMLKGETIVIRTQIKAGALNPATGEPYPDRATVKSYHPYGFEPNGSGNGALVTKLLEEQADDMPFTPAKGKK